MIENRISEHDSGTTFSKAPSAVFGHKEPIKLSSGSRAGYATVHNKDENRALLSPHPLGDPVPSLDTGKSRDAIFFGPITTVNTKTGSEQQLSLQQVAGVQVATGARPQRTPTALSCTSRQRRSFREVPSAEYPEHDRISDAQVPYTAAEAIGAIDAAWCVSERLIPVLGLELFLFRHFVHVVGKLLDFHDQEMHFTSTVPHLALRNMGLMKALLALSARHFSLVGTQKEDLSRSLVEDDNTSTTKGRENTPDRNLAVKYYTESIHYLNSAMQYPSHTQSLALAAAAMLISTYEMIDGCYENWERHIQGLSWIQRSPNSYCESSGLRLAVWWAWLQQDTWIAMRERRRTYSIWKPQRQTASLTAPELARRASYLLAQCVNYISQEERQEDSAWRADRGDELLYLLQEWRDTLPLEYNPLPLTSDSNVFPAIWVNPASYAAALQTQSLALILVVLHHPSLGAIGNDQRPKQMLTAAVNTICGIARCVRAGDIGANLVSLKCLYGGKLSRTSDLHKILISYSGNVCSRST